MFLKTSNDDTAKTTLMDLLCTGSPNKVFFSIMLGVFSGLAYAMLIPLVLSAINTDTVNLPTVSEDTYVLFRYEISDARFALAFLSICIFVFLTRTASLLLLESVAINATMSLRKSMYRRITQLPIEDLENIGSAKLITLIATDVPRLIMGASALPQIIISVATIVGLLGFLIFLNTSIFMFTIGGIIFGLVTYRLPMYLGERNIHRARSYFDAIQEGIQGLIYGSKELKLNQEKREGYLRLALDKNENSYKRYQRAGRTMIIAATSYGEILCFLVIGTVVYVLSGAYDISLAVLSGVVMALLYITTPMTIILNALNPVILASSSLKRFNLLASQMPIEHQAKHHSARPFSTITLSDIEFRYRQHSDHRSGFSIGPIDASFNRGEVSFIVGGNGSGKSTLGKIISLHYLPTQGNIQFDDTIITDLNRDEFRQQISAIYTDFHVFSRLFGQIDSKQEKELQQYLRELYLHDKVHIDNGEFSTTALSDGQRKRLALLVAYLEDRDVYIFDEWAADQDPEFKDTFYLDILPRLKQREKIVIVITHDDRYFEFADKIIYMENGKFRRDKVSERSKNSRAVLSDL